MECLPDRYFRVNGGKCHCEIQDIHQKSICSFSSCLYLFNSHHLHQGSKLSTRGWYSFRSDTGAESSTKFIRSLNFPKNSSHLKPRNKHSRIHSNTRRQQEINCLRCKLPKRIPADYVKSTSGLLFWRKNKPQHSFPWFIDEKAPMDSGDNIHFINKHTHFTHLKFSFALYFLCIIRKLKKTPYCIF